MELKLWQPLLHRIHVTDMCSALSTWRGRSSGFSARGVIIYSKQKKCFVMYEEMATMTFIATFHVLHKSVETTPAMATWPRQTWLPSVMTRP